jgi:hypothetical protein
MKCEKAESENNLNQSEKYVLVIKTLGLIVGFAVRKQNDQSGTFARPRGTGAEGGGGLFHT